ncbi:MAG: endonuclease, partial [Gammaproteobacteria bacterium]|nr:endonuclease [Gammaproteobacteria bacterium]
MAPPDPASLYKALRAQHGPQRWWPADSRFEVLVGAVLTQNTNWRNVEIALSGLREVGALHQPEPILHLHPRRLASLLRPSGYFNVKARRLRALCQMVVSAGGLDALDRLATDRLRDALLAVNGVGPETADDILLYAFDRPVFVVDAYTRRLLERLGHEHGASSYDTVRDSFESALPRRVPLYQEFHALIVVHAKTLCRPRPRCG